jgi:hypothetical protein
VVNQVNEQSRPFPFTELTRNVKFPGEIDPNKFPNVQVNSVFAREHKIESVIGKTSWTLQVVNSNYNAEIIVFHIWGSDTSQPPETGGGLQLYGAEWNDDMQFHDQAGGARDWEDFENQFLDSFGSNNGDGFGRFLAIVNRMLGAMDSVAA